MKKVLVTGASGFIGSFIVEEGLKRGYEIHATIRKTSNLQYLQDPRIKLKEIDFDNEGGLRQMLSSEHYDYIIHNAGITKAKNPEAYFKVNSAYTRKLIKILHEEGVLPRKFVYMSSMASYGPADFQAKGIVDHESTPHPVTTYGESKLQAEQFIQTFDLDYVILRPTAVFGPRETDFNTLYKSIKKGIEMYIGSADQQLSFIYVKDLVDLVYKSMSSDVTKVSYFVSDGKVYPSAEYNSLLKKALDKKTIKFVLPLGIVKSIATLAELSSKISGNYPIINHDKLGELTAKNWRLDTSLQEKQLGFKAKYSLEEAIQETIQWNIANKKL